MKKKSDVSATPLSDLVRSDIPKKTRKKLRRLKVPAAVLTAATDALEDAPQRGKRGTRSKLTEDERVQKQVKKALDSDLMYTSTKKMFTNVFTKTMERALKQVEKASRPRKKKHVEVQEDFTDKLMKGADALATVLSIPIVEESIQHARAHSTLALQRQGVPFDAETGEPDVDAMQQEGAMMQQALVERDNVIQTMKAQMAEMQQKMGQAMGVMKAQAKAIAKAKQSGVFDEPVEDEEVPAGEESDESFEAQPLMDTDGTGGLDMKLGSPAPAAPKKQSSVPSFNMEFIGEDEDEEDEDDGNA
tara:strand:+ start:11502 stop:12410 length:909 start_codon:yes stop_codon:yes gene_type:complete